MLDTGVFGRWHLSDPDCTGPYVGASGQGMQELLGFNASTGVNLRFELPVQPM